MSRAETSSSSGLPPALWALLFGNFVVGCGVNAVSASLPEISGSLRVPVSEAGQLITASSFVVAVAAPLSAAVVAGWDRRRLLALAIAWYGLLHLLCAFMPNLPLLTAARVLAMVAPAVYTPQAAACAGLLAPTHLRGRAITFVFLGFSASSVLGVPLAAFVSGTFGWQMVFVLVAVFALANAVWIWRTVPAGLHPPRLSLAAWGETFRSPALMTCLAVTVMLGSAQFTLYAYLTPYLKQLVGVSTMQLSMVLLWMGVCGLLGNSLLSRNIDRIGASRATMISLILLATSLLLWPLAINFVLAALLLTPWALGYFSANSAQQARLAGIAPRLASASIALNTSSIYWGQAIGAAVGGVLVAHDQWHMLSWAALAVMLATMGVSMLGTRLTRRAAAA